MGFKHSVDPAYQNAPGAGWMCRDSTLGLLKKMAGSSELTGWLPNARDGGTPLLDGNPIYVNQDVAAAGSAAKLLLFGDFKKYIIREVRDVTLIRLDERYAEFGQVAFLAWWRGDGDLIDAGTHPVKYLADKT
jgi:HK97 family phage major capsid protein